MYKNEHLGVEIRYPRDWNILSEEPYGQRVAFEPEQSDRKFSGFSVGPFQPIRESWFDDFDHWVHDVKRAMEAAGDKILREEALTISGYPAIRLTSGNGNASTGSVAIDIFIGVSVSGRSRGQVFDFGYAPPSSPAFQHDQDRLYEQILSSLKITPEA